MMITLSVGKPSAKSKVSGKERLDRKASARDRKGKAEQPRHPSLTAFKAHRSRLIGQGLTSDDPRVLELDQKIEAIMNGKPVPVATRRSAPIDLDRLESADQARRHVAALRATRTRREREGADKSVIEDLRKREDAIIARFPDAKEPRRKAQAEPEEPEEQRELWVDRFEANRAAITAAIDRIRARRNSAIKRKAA